MAARKPRTLTAEDVFLTHPEQPPAPSYPVVPPSPEEEVEEDEVTALNNILSEIGGRSSGGGYVNVFREITHAGGKLDRPYLGQMQAADFVNGGFIEALKQQYGAGKYDLCVYVTGHRGVYDRKKITIADDRAAAPMGNMGGMNTHAIIVDAINQGNERTLQAILALAQQKQQQPDIMGQLQMLKMMREVLGPTTPAQGNVGNTVSEMMQVFKMGLEVARTGNMDPESTAGWVDKVVDKVVSPMMDMLTPRAGQPSPAMIGAQPRIAPPQHAPAVNTTNPETPDVNPMISFYLNTLKAKAVKNEPVEPVADDILARLSASEANDLKGILAPDTWRDTLRKHTAALDQNPEWWGRLRNTILQYIAEDATAHIPDYFAGGLTVIPAAGISANHDSQQPATTNPETAGQGLPGGNP